MFEPDNKEEQTQTGTESAGEKRDTRETRSIDIGQLLGGYSVRKGLQEEEAKYVEMVKEGLKEFPGIGLHIFPKDYRGISYDTLVLVDMREKDAAVKPIFTSVVASSNEEYMTGEAVRDILVGERDGQLLLPGTAVNENLLMIIEDEFKREYGVTGIDSLGGLVTLELSEGMADRLVTNAARAFDAYAGLVTDSEIYDALNSNDRLVSKLMIDETNGTVEVAPGDVRYVNAVVTTFLTSETRSRLPNSGGFNVTMASSGAFVSVIPYRDRDIGNTVIPEIVTNTVYNPTSALGPVLADIYNSTALGADRTWLRILANDARNGRDIGAVQALFTDEKGERLPRVKFTKKDSLKDIERALFDMVTDMPVYAVICKPFFEGGTDLNPFVELANGDLGAGEIIVQSLHDITGGRFPLDYDPNHIIAASNRIFGGVYVEDGKQRPLEQIDIPEVVGKTLDNKSIPDDVISEFISIFLTGEEKDDVKKLEIYSILGWEVYVNTIAYKIHLEGAFIDALIDAFDDTIFNGAAERFFGVDIGRGRLDIDGISRYVSRGISTSKRHTRYTGKTRRSVNFDFKTGRGGVW